MRRLRRSSRRLDWRRVYPALQIVMPSGTTPRNRVNLSENRQRAGAGSVEAESHADSGTASTAAGRARCGSGLRLTLELTTLRNCLTVIERPRLLRISWFL